MERVLHAGRAGRQPAGPDRVPRCRHRGPVRGQLQAVVRRADTARDRGGPRILGMRPSLTWKITHRFSFLKSFVFGTNVVSRLSLTIVNT